MGGGLGTGGPVRHGHGAHGGSLDNAAPLRAGRPASRFAHSPTSSTSARGRRRCRPTSVPGSAGTERIVPRGPTAYSIKPLNQDRNAYFVGYWQHIPAWQSVGVRYRSKLGRLGRCRACSLRHPCFTAPLLFCRLYPPFFYDPKSAADPAHTHLSHAEHEISLGYCSFGENRGLSPD